MKIKSHARLSGLALAAACLSPAGAQAATTYDYSLNQAGTYQLYDLGSFSAIVNGSLVTGEEWKHVTTRTSSSYITHPVTPLPASLPTWTSTTFSVLTAAGSVWLSGYGSASDNTGDSLSWIQTAHSVLGNTFHTENAFTGGTGLYTGASGWSIADGTSTRLTSLTGTQSWISETHLVIPSPVPEPETYAMLMAGLGLLGFMSRRRK